MKVAQVDRTNINVERNKMVVHRPTVFDEDDVTWISMSEKEVYPGIGVNQVNIPALYHSLERNVASLCVCNDLCVGNCGTKCTCESGPKCGTNS